MRLLFEDEDCPSTIREFQDISLMPGWNANRDPEKDIPDELTLCINYEYMGQYHTNGSNFLYTMALENYNKIQEKLLKEGYCRSSDFDECDCFEWLEALWEFNPETRMVFHEILSGEDDLYLDTEEDDDIELNADDFAEAFPQGLHCMHINGIGAHELATMLAMLPHNTAVAFGKQDDAGIIYVPEKEMVIIDDSSLLKELFAIGK